MLGLESLFSKIKIEIFLQKKDGSGEEDSTFPHYCLTLFYSLSIYCASSSHISFATFSGFGFCSKAVQEPIPWEAVKHLSRVLWPLRPVS